MKAPSGASVDGRGRGNPGTASPPAVDLVYFTGCPHLDAARAALREAFRTVGRAAGWREWEAGDPSLPAYAAGFGSPTILVAGCEITGSARGDAPGACRLYAASEGGALQGAPPPETIVAALLGSGR